VNGELPVLQALRMKGRAAAVDLVPAVGADAPAVRVLLADLAARGLVAEKGGRHRLTPAGRERLAALLVEEREELDGAALEAVHRDFVALNGRFKGLAAAWQQDDDGRAALLTELGGLHPELLALLDRLTAAAPRTAPYARRFERALGRIRSGDHGWLLGPLIDSYHTVWFELHEELLGLTGRTREAEAAAGRAQ